MSEQRSEDELDALRDGVSEGFQNLFDGVNSQELIDQIGAGVSDAVWRVATNRTDAPCADFYEMIGRGVQEALRQAMPDTEDILDRIEKAVYAAVLAAARERRQP